MDNLFILVVLMGLVTYIPRLIPVLWLSNVKLSGFWNSFFYYLPFAMLSALIFPSILYSCGSLKLSIIGAVSAIILSLYNLNSTIVVVLGVSLVYFFNLLFNGL